MKTHVYRESAAFERLRPQWNALLHQSVTDRIFLTWEWQAAWWKHLGVGELHLLTLRTDSGTLAGIAPLCKVASQSGEQTFRWVGCVDISDYLDVIALPGYERALYDAFLDYLASPDAGPWHYVDLCNIHQNSPTHMSLTDLARLRGLHARNEIQDVCPVIHLPATWDAYMESLDKKQRHEIRRKMRRIHREADARWYITEDPERLDTAIEVFVQLHKASDPDKHAFMDEQMTRFFREMCQAVFAANWLQLAFIEVNGDAAATMLSFDYQNEILVYNSGYAPGKYASLSPGIVLLAYCIQNAIETRRHRFDFLRGDEEYKFRFGAVGTTVHRVMLSPNPLP